MKCRGETPRDAVSTLLELLVIGAWSLLIPPCPSTENVDFVMTDGSHGSLDDSPCLQGERVAFTGILASMTHRQAMELAQQHGGEATGHVSKQTTMLVVGEEGWPLEDDGQPSVKLQQVMQWRGEGLNIRIVNESEWLHLLGLEQRRREVHRLTTPAMLSQMLDVSVNVIRRWERIGLIKAVRKVYRLPYFDYQEVASARRLSQLLAAGVPRREIEASLGKLQEVLTGVNRPLAQLDILERDSHVVYRDDRGYLVPASGQRLFDFDISRSESAHKSLAHESRPTVNETSVRAAERSQSHWTFDDWFDQGCRLLDESDPNAAMEAFRLCLIEKPSDPKINFHLAEALYRAGNLQGALERYYAVIESDRDYIEAWTQLGCVHQELGQLDAALDAFNIALNAHPDYPDAHFHKAQVLHQLKRTAEAVPDWQAYLQFDSRGPWAETARQRLEEAGD